MSRFHCPECGFETEVIPQYGDEVVSVFCIKHTGGADAHTRPVYMTRVPVAVPVAEHEPVFA